MDPWLNGFDPGCPQLPLWLYIEYLEKFRDSLTPVWPIVDIDSLVERLKNQSPDDYEAFALAGAVCATVIAQLRLSQLRLPKQQRSTSDISVVAETFARHAQHLRDQHSYRESESTDSLLTAFFLHVYFANTERIRAGAMYLHEAIAQLSLQRLHQPETFDHLPEEQRELMLRIFWLVFVTERWAVFPHACLSRICFPRLTHLHCSIERSVFKTASRLASPPYERGLPRGIKYSAWAAWTRPFSCSPGCSPCSTTTC